MILFGEPPHELTCFECNQPIGEREKHFTTSQELPLHWSCVRLIVDNHIQNQLDQDLYNTKRMEEQEAKADRLGFLKRFQFGVLEK